MHSHVRLETKGTDDSPTNQARHGLDAIGYLTYAIVLVYVMLFDALGPVVWYDSPYATEQILLCRDGSRGRFVISGVFVIETMTNSRIMRFAPRYSIYSTANVNLWNLDCT